jgi:DNA-binding NarL/FixJ family response regulator
VKNNVEDVYQLYCSQIAQTTPTGPRHRTAASGRYEQVRDLMAENLDIAQIAERMNLSVPSIYNLRTRFKARLLKDVGQEVKGMRFTKSHEDAS